MVVHRRDLGGDRTVGGVVTTLHDVTAERQLRLDLEHRATHDPLTGLANGTLFRERLRRPPARRSPGRAVMVIDLDDFKTVNDTFGHLIGDGLLTVVARRVESCVRAGDLPARLGGDEFAVLLDGIAPEAADEIAQRVSDALARPAPVGGITLDPQASVGLAHAGAGDDGATLLRDADSALYAAKAAGKGRWRRHHPGMPVPTRQHLRVRTRLEAALATHRLELRYQPIVETATARAVGFEAVPRLADGGQPLTASEIIRSAEATGQVTELGDWVLERALADVHRLNAAAPHRYVSVNVAGRQLRLPDFADRVRRVLRRTAADPRHLVLEITESELVEDDDRAWGLLADLRADGVRVAIDDYGTGYASLGYLRQPAIDIVKVDGSFLADPHSARARRLIKAVTDLTADLGIDQVAEGVESPTTRRLLVDLGCRLAQGRYFSRPLPIAAAATWTFDGARPLSS